MTATRRHALAWAGAAVVAYLVAAVLLPHGMPVEVLVPGITSGALIAFTALPLVLIYRATRVVNFAQANLGGLVTTLVVLLVGVLHWSYWLAVPFGLVVALVLSVWVERGLLGPLRESPRLIVTVATIGVAQLLGAATLYISGTKIDLFGWVVPTLFNVPEQAGTVLAFHVPLSFQFSLGSLVITADYLIALVAVPAVLLALGWYFNRTDSGIGARAAADSTERAVLLGIPVRRLSLTTWMVAGAMSALGGILGAGVAGFQTSIPSGPESLIAPLAAAVIAGFDSLAVAFVASVAIGLVQQAIFWSYGDPSLTDLAMFLIILGALLLRRRVTSRVGGGDDGGFVGVPEPRPLPPSVASLREVKIAKGVGLALVLGITCVLPVWMSNPQLAFFAFVAIFVVVAASMLLLTGWGGQVSLGQFGFVGLGAGTTGGLLANQHASVLLCLLASMAVGAMSAFLIGVPALRIRGIYLAVATLAFAAPASTFFLSSRRFPSLTPSRVDLPLLFSRFDLAQPRTFYYLCLLVALVSLVLVRNFRRSRLGRATIALRDNERFAAAVSISDRRVRLSTFAISGAIAGLAGGLYVMALRGIPNAGFAPVFSLQAFTMVVVGGMTSVWGAVLGAVYFYGTSYFLGPTAQLFTTGGGIVLVLTLAPGGLADLGYRGRDLAVGWLLDRRGLGRNLLFSRAEEEGARPSLHERLTARLPRMHRPKAAPPMPSGGHAMLDVQQLEAGYGHLQILFGTDLDVTQGEVFALLGTNGAGKSTILKVVAGLLPARSGRVFLDGEDITRLIPAERVERGVVLVPGGRGVFGSLTVAENLRLAAWLARRRSDDAFIDDTMTRVFELFPVLRERSSQRAGLMSGGEQQMLTIAQALLCKPKLLMIDELSLGLAPSVVGELLEVIRRLNGEGMTVVLVEQSMNVAATVAPRAVFLEKGSVRFSGPTKELASKENLVRSVFFAEDRTEAEPTQRAATTDTRVVLEARGLVKTYGGVTAVDQVDLQLLQGSIIGVIGANGAGKTTLFDVMCGFVLPDDGHVLLHGRDITRMPPSARFALGLGRTFQDLRLVPSLTVRETIAVACERHIDVRDAVSNVLALPASVLSELDTMTAVDALVETLHLERFANSFIAELSTGTRRIVELAAVSAHRPSVLVLDEPSSGLAQKEAEAMVPALFALRDRIGATIAIIEHDIPMITRLADDVVCMHLGGVLSRGSAETVLSDPAVVSAYLGVDDAAVNRSGSRPAGRRLAAAGPRTGR